MNHSPGRTKLRRIAIAIEIDRPYPHHVGCYAGILRYAATRHDWQTVVDPFLVGLTHQAGLEEYDGVVGRISRKVAREAEAVGIPVVNHWVNSPARDVPSVLPDLHRGGRMAADHLLARGFRRFGYVGSRTSRSHRLHLAGFESAVRDRGLAVETFDLTMVWEATAKTFVESYRRLKAWMARLPTPVALLVPLEFTALYIAQACHELGLRVPHDVGLLTCRENPTICLQTTPTLSCIEDDNERIGYVAAELLDSLMQPKAKPPTEPLWIEPKAVKARGSTDAFVSEDPIVSRAMRFIAEHASRAITVNDVAKAAETSPRTLQLRFAHFVGRSVYSEINRLRIETVKRILLDSTVPLETIASDHGFTDVSHLVKTFRGSTGTTPGEFRKNHRIR